MWGDRFVGEAALATGIRTARLPVGDSEHPAVDPDGPSPRFTSRCSACVAGRSGGDRIRGAPRRAVSRLILAGAYAGVWSGPAATPSATRRRSISNSPGWFGTARTRASLGIRLAVPSGRTPEEWEDLTSFQRRTASPENGARFLDEFARIDGSAIAGQVRCPTLIVHCRDDLRVRRAQAAELACHQVHLVANGAYRVRPATCRNDRGHADGRPSSGGRCPTGVYGPQSADDDVAVSSPAIDDVVEVVPDERGRTRPEQMRSFLPETQFWKVCSSTSMVRWSRWLAGQVSTPGRGPRGAPAVWRGCAGVGPAGGGCSRLPARR